MKSLLNKLKTFAAVIVMFSFFMATVSSCTNPKKSGEDTGNTQEQTSGSEEHPSDGGEEHPSDSENSSDSVSTAEEEHPTDSEEHPTDN